MPAPVERDVVAAIESLRPLLQADGGDIVFRAVDGDGVVHVVLTGACGTCPLSTTTMQAGVQRILRDRVPGVQAVEAVDAADPA